MAIHGGRGKNIFICCQNRLAAQHTARAQLGTAVQRDTALSPAAGTKGFLWSWRAREGNASLWSAAGTKPRGSCSGSSRFWLSFTLSMCLIKSVSFCREEEWSLLLYWLLRSAKILPVQVPWEECCSSKACAGLWVCDFRVRSQKTKISTVFPAQTAPCSPSLFCLLLIKVKLFLRADMSVWELPQLLFSMVNNGKQFIFDQGTTCFTIWFFFKLSVKKHICNELNTSFLCHSRRETLDECALLHLRKWHKSDMKIRILQSSGCVRNPTCCCAGESSLPTGSWCLFTDT